MIWVDQVHADSEHQENRVKIYINGGNSIDLFGKDQAEFLEQWQRLVTVNQIQAELQALQQNMAAQAQQLQAAKAQYEQAMRNQPGG